MNIAIIGSGMVADTHAEAINHLEGCRLFGVAGRDPEKAEAFAKKYGSRGFESVEALLAEPELDIVTIATPSGNHLEQCRQGAEAGKHILVEKPVEITPERVDQVIQICRDAGVLLAPILNRRFNPAVEALKKAVDAGRFENLVLCSANIHWFRDQEYYDSGAWRGTWELDGGGVLMNQGIHTVDRLIHIAGDISTVSATTACLAHTGIEVEDVAALHLQFANGARGTIEATTGCWSAEGHPAEIAICGSAGSAFLHDETFRRWEFRDEQPEDEEIRQTLLGSVKAHGANDPKAINYEGHRRNFADAVAAIKENRPLAATPQDARRAVAVICAAYESARDGGKPIQVS
jgi:predicted dehydrogenase